MPENEFENEVQLKMEEFKINPSAAVWDGVALAMGKQKRRSSKIILSALFVCFFLATSLRLFDPHTFYFFKKQMIVNGSDTSKENNETRNDITTLKEKFHTKNKTSLRNNNKNQPIKTTLISAGNTTENRQKDLPIQTKKSGLFTKKTSNISDKKMLAITTIPLKIIADKSAIDVEDNKFDSITKNNQLSPIITVIKKDTVAYKEPRKKKKVTLPVKTSAADVATKNIPVKKGNWIFGVTFSAAAASTNHGYFGAHTNNDNLYAINTPTNNNTDSFVHNSSKINAGAAFAMGIVATHTLTLKSNIILALTYKFVSTSMLVGNSSTLNSQGTYAIGNTKKYLNQYHFIELPVTFQTTIGAVKNHPFYLETGLVISQLINSNALQFNQTQGRYFIDNTLFNKTGIGLSFGLSVNLLNNKKPPLLIGPQIYYSVTSMASTGLYAESHYSFAGIKIQKMLRKIK